MFSNRLPPHAEPNPLARALARLRAAGTAIADLTESNPTRAGLDYPPELLQVLGDARGLRYEPVPQGLLEARAAVAADYGRRGARVDPSRIVLAASTSDAYGWLFKLLCNPGDGVLVPQPSYSLFEHLTRLEAVRAIPYRLAYHGRWEIDFDTLARAPEGVRAVLIVSPNNPTGSYVTRDDARTLAGICRRRGWAIVADEVFADYPVEGGGASEIFLDEDVLSFTLGGASKSLGLPQVKLGWLVVHGPPAACRAALAALEIIADTFLSVGTPVQQAAAALLASGGAIRAQIRRRLAANLAAARTLAAAYPSCTVLPVEGGWSLVLRVPATRSEDAIVLGLLERQRVLVHPGYFFDFAHEAFLVLSLLPVEAVFRAAFARVLQDAGGEPLHPGPAGGR